MKLTAPTISCIIQVILLATFASAADIIKPYTFVNGATADANQVNANFDTVYGQTNINTSNINMLANSNITGISSRIVSSGSAYYASGANVSALSVTSCAADEYITGGSCSCTHANFNSTTTNWGVVNYCSPVGNSMVGSCFADAITYNQYKFGPPITTYSICATISKTLGKTVPKTVNESVEAKYQAELRETLDKLSRDRDEYVRISIEKIAP